MNHFEKGDWEGLFVSCEWWTQIRQIVATDLSHMIVFLHLQSSQKLYAPLALTVTVG